ncbi:putative ribonuclease H-like domain, reverse transcriptase zinc-binding domain-containing protein [Rosa chinensis]|uniref:Putative ribonuclease H-like domain, reverse transcriptase zinc-binding domain-containing protein n=1 Tax=Rosa chinensis TaxID=74649 RepID=A0A2P6R124_ROSCH|nr:putative ribonuclease H-like domain, reverse transcriptase zinc-binding domain-containing protein [Rosa chinensis]
MERLKILAGAKVFLWRALHDILPTAVNLHRRHLLSSPICARCNMAPKTTLHTLWSCKKVKQVWYLSPFRNAIGSWKNGTFLELFIYATSLSSMSELSFIVIMCRRLLQNHNEEYFQGKFISPQLIHFQVQHLVQEFVVASIPPPLGSSTSTAASIEHWVKPLFPYLKLNVDGAVDLKAGLSGLGAMLRNDRGEMMLAVSKGMQGRFTPKATELFAAILGLQACIEAGFQSSLMLEMDALEVIRDLPEEEDNMSMEGVLIEEVKIFFCFFSSVICTYTSRNCNQVAHILVRKALLFPAFQAWVEDGPHWLSEVLISDVNISIA